MGTPRRKFSHIPTKVEVNTDSWGHPGFVSSVRTAATASHEPEDTTMRTTLLPIAALIAVSATAGAQATSTRLRIEPGSELSIAWTSNVHDFLCKTNKFSAYIDVDPGYSTKDLTRVTRPIVSVNVVIAVKSLSCGNNKMDQNLYSTLKADKNHIIRYTLSGYDILNGSASAFAAK